MEQLHESQLATDAEWAKLKDAYRRTTAMLRAEAGKIQQAHEDLKCQQDEIASRHGDVNADSSDVLDINAGGKIISVTRGTLTHLQGTPLAGLFSGRWDDRLKMDGTGSMFLDVNPEFFQSIIDYLNESKISPPDAPPDPPVIDEDDKVVFERLLEIFGMKNVYHPYSTTLTDPSHTKALRGFLLEDGEYGELELLYRGSRDGFGAEDFHGKCDNKGATVTVIRDVGGSLFGGFTEKSWKSEGNLSTADKAFLFSLNNNSGLGPIKMRMKESEKSNAMYN